MEYATHILRELRQLVPTRPLTLAEGQQLAEQHASLLLAMLGTKRPAVDVRPLAKLPGVVVTVVPNLAISGLCEHVRGQWIVAIRGKDHLTRRRFCLAREFWQVLIDGRDLFPATDAATARRWMHACADYFAASLLMPKAWVFDAWARGLREVHYLAGYFLVSKVAMTHRLHDLGLITDGTASRTVTSGRHLHTGPLGYLDPMAA